jgi:hypothetical protein
MYSLAKQYNDLGIPKEGGDNWLSDFGTNQTDEKAKKIAENRAANRQSPTVTNNIGTAPAGTPFAGG